MLVGTLTGTNRAEILTRVKEAATTYFDSKCVVVKLANERIGGEAFAADYTAQVWHDLEHPGYGPAFCRGCKAKSWPHDPLNKTKAWE